VEELREYFNKNINAYSYLFFAYASFTAIKIYNNFAIQHPPKIFPSQFLIWPTLVTYLIPGMFTLAAFATFDYSSIKNDKLWYSMWNVFIIAVIIVSASMP